jgi:hypothetical protein
VRAGGYSVLLHQEPTINLSTLWHCWSTKQITGPIALRRFVFSCNKTNSVNLFLIIITIDLKVTKIVNKSLNHLVRLQSQDSSARRTVFLIMREIGKTWQSRAKVEFTVYLAPFSFESCWRGSGPNQSYLATWPDEVGKGEVPVYIVVVV